MNMRLKSNNAKSLAQIALLVVFCLSLVQGQAQDAVIKEAPQQSEPCWGKDSKSPVLNPQEIYRSTPYSALETAAYKIYFYSVFVGFGHLKVAPPEKVAGDWHRVFAVDASTGDWYRAFFVANDDAKAYSRPWDYGITQFHINQDEGKLWGKRFIEEKTIQFDHAKCKVTETIKRPDKESKVETVYFKPFSADVLGVSYQMREIKYKLGAFVRLPVYSSQKNWWLEIAPIAHEKITVGAGTFMAVKLKLQTYIGKEMQQKGDVYVWIATEHPNRPMVKVQGDIQIGKVYFELDSYTPGR